MRLAALQKLLDTDPEVGAYIVRIMFKTHDEFERLPVHRVEFDSHD